MPSYHTIAKCAQEARNPSDGCCICEAALDDNDWRKCAVPWCHNRLCIECAVVATAVALNVSSVECESSGGDTPWIPADPNADVVCMSCFLALEKDWEDYADTTRRVNRGRNNYS